MSQEFQIRMRQHLGMLRAAVVKCTPYTDHSGPEPVSRIHEVEMFCRWFGNPLRGVLPGDAERAREWGFGIIEQVTG